MSTATVTVKEPVPGYDGLKTKDVVASLSGRSQVELAEIDGYERAHENRTVIFDKLRWLRQDEPLPGYDALSTEGVIAALEKADLTTIKRVRGYERKFAARRVVLDEVTRLHRERRLPLVSRDANRQPEHLADHHHAAQLIERVGWAVTDAQEAEEVGR